MNRTVLPLCNLDGCTFTLLGGGVIWIAHEYYWPKLTEPCLQWEIALLNHEVNVVGTAADGATSFSDSRPLSPDVIVTTLDLPILSGIDAMRELLESGSTARFVFIKSIQKKSFCFAPEFLDTELSVFMQRLRVQGAAGAPGLV